MTLTHELARFAVKNDVSEEVIEILRLSFVDWMAVALAGKDEPVANVVRKLAEDEAGAPRASIIGFSTKYPARMAAMVNGTIGHALDYDDTHFAHIGHPSAVILPAMLAVSQSEGLSGRAMQEAALIGAEASIRVGLWLGRSHYQAGFHQTATAGVFGAALGLARLSGFTVEQTEQVLGLVSTRASGLKSQFGSMGKPFNAGLAASNAVEAIMLVKHGFHPNAEGLEAVQGFGDTHSGVADEAVALAGLGQKWLFSTVSHKFHACCHGLHAALEAFRPMRGRATDIASITVHTNPRWLRVCNIMSPTDGLECKFSYRHVLAMAAHDQDTAGIEAYTVASANDPSLGAFRGKVTVVGDDTVSETATSLSIQMTDKSVRTLIHDLDTPISVSEKRARIAAKAVALVGVAKAEQFRSLIEGYAAPNDIAAALAQ